MSQDNFDMSAKIAGRLGGGRVGDLLRRRRAELGQDIAVVAKALRIRQRYLEAIEEGRLVDLPGPTYVLGFVRSYAEHLGFDGTKIIAEFRAEFGIAGAPQPMQWKAQTQSPGGRSGLLFFIAIVIALCAGWYFLGRQVLPPEVVDSLPGFLQPRAQTAPPESGAEATDEATSSEATPSQSPVTEGSVGEADAPAEPGNDAQPAGAADTTSMTLGATTQDAQQPSATAAVAVSETAPGAAVIAGSSDGDPLGAGVTAGTQPASTTTSGIAGVSVASAPATGDGASDAGQAQDEAMAPGPKVVLRARLESWVEVVDANKQVLVSRVLRAGETYLVPNQPGLVLSTGNAGGLDVEVDGRTAPALGAVGLVRRGISLDPALLASGQTNSPGAAPAPPEPDTTSTGN